MKRIAILAIIAAISGCAGTPKWAKKGSAAFKPSDKVFYGVGQADEGIRSRNLRMEAADNRARADLQRYFDTYTGYLMKEYDGTEGEMVDRVIKTFSAGHISGVRIVDRYEKGETIHSLAKLDLDEFRRVMQNAPQLTERTKKFLNKRSEELFDELRKEEIEQAAGKKP
ncbi:MAG: hypothetical protein ABII00_12365 [Elusimicrobiota bacterium]